MANKASQKMAKAPLIIQKAATTFLHALARFQAITTYPL
jgi:hypothetical protein